MPTATKVQQRAVADLIPYPANPRVVTDDAVAACAESVRRFGWTQPIEVGSDGVIINGHTRRLAAKLLHLDTVPVVVSVLTGAEARAARIADNRAAEFSSWDPDRLAAEVEQIADNTDALLPSFDEEAIGAMLAGSQPPGPTDDPAATPDGEHAAAVAPIRTCAHCGFEF